MAAKVLGVGYSIRSEEDFGFTRLGAALDEAAQVGVEFVELPLYQWDVIAGGRIVPEKLRAAKQICAGRPFRYTVHGPIATNLMDDPEKLSRHKAVVAASLEACAELGGVHYILHNGTVEPKHAHAAEDRYAQQRDALCEAGDLAAARNIIITVENLFSYNADKVVALPSRLAAEIQAVNHPNVAACIDFSHAYINCTLRGADFTAEIAAMAPLTRHLHVHDSFGQPHDITTFSRPERVAYGLGDLHLPPRWGSIPWDAMQRMPYAGDLIIIYELAPPYWMELANCVTFLRDFRQQLAAG